MVSGLSELSNTRDRIKPNHHINLREALEMYGEAVNGMGR